MPAPKIEDAPKVTKGDTTYSYLETQNALMPVAVAQAFVEAISAEPTLLNDVNTFTMEAQKQRISVAGFGGRISYPDRAGIAATEAERSSLVVDSPELDAQRLKATVFLDYQSEKDNIMQFGVLGFVQMLMAKQVALDAEENVVLGDETSLTAALALFDGLIAQATSHVIDYTSDPHDMDDQVLQWMRQELPAKYWRDLPNMRFYCSPRAEGAYQYYCKNNPAAIGYRYDDPDMGSRMLFAGVPLKTVYSMPDDTIILTHRMNVNVGFWERMSLKTQEDIDAGVDKFVLRYSLDTKYKEEAGVVVFKGVDVGTVPTL